jgi:chorismate mutase
VGQAADDPVVNELREQIAELDRSIIASVNRRLELVARLKRHKEEQGLPFFDPEREAYLVSSQVEANPGPLSEKGLRRFYTGLLALVKRELEPDADSAES